MAEILKPSLPEQVYANKNCGNGQQDCLTSLCILNIDENNLTLRYTENNYRIYYNASKKPNNSIKSNLIIYGGNNGAIPISHFLDKSNLEQFKLTSYRSVIEESNKLSKHSGLSISNVEESLVENLILSIKTQESNLVHSELAKSIYFNIAILKSTKRALESNSEDCNCAPVPMYYKDESPFICQEDLSYNVNTLLEKIDENINDISQNYDTVTIETVKEYLESKANEGDFISFEDSYVDLSNGIPTNTFNIAIEDYIETSWCILGQGTDLGCCGNYAGCCWYWSTTCFLHDVACLNCEPAWFCFTGCQSN
jgi:hypothetical protein